MVSIMPAKGVSAFGGRIALVHDSLTQLGGAERVLDVFHEMFPEAPVFTLVLDKKLEEKYKGWDIRTSKLQKLYQFFPKFKYWLAFIPWAVSTLNFEGYDFVLSSSSSFVKNILVPQNCIHICYCHTPTRFLWIDKEYINQEVPFFLRTIAKFFLKKIKIWDYKGSQRVSEFIANSSEVQKRIEKYYDRNSIIVYPPVDTNFWKPVLSDCFKELSVDKFEQQNNMDAKKITLDATAMTQKKDYFLLAGRLQAHKHNELIVEVFNDLGLSLHVAGTGRHEKYLKSIAKPNIKFLGQVGDERLREEYSGALGYIYPQIEDFGLMPLEAAACGAPTLAYAKGGALETVLEGETGEFFYSYNKAEIKKIILEWDINKYKKENLKSQAEKFSKARFIQEILNFASI